MDSETVFKLKEGFLLREIAGRIVAVPAGAVLDMDLMITLNGTGRFLWDRLETGASARQLTRALTEEYEVSPSQAQADVDAFVEKLRQNGFLA